MSGTTALETGGDDETDQVRGVTKLTILLAFAIFATSIYANLPHALGLKWLYSYVPPFDGRDLSLLDHLGAEHRLIAEALSEGRGFADPFQERTGPTAWIAPVLPTIEALLLTLGGIRLAVIAVTILHNIALVFTGWLVLRAAARSRWPQAPAVSLLLFLALTWSRFHSSYQLTHDSWLIMSLVGVLVYWADRSWAHPFGRRTAICWGLLGGVATLSGPVLAPVWATLTFLLARSSRQVRPFITSFLVAAVVMTPWIVRNAIVFGRFIPVKSNLFYELYQSNDLEPDGLLRAETGKTHPLQDARTERAHYRRLGEMAYLDEYRARSLETIRRDPSGYLSRIRNRLLAATLAFHAFFRDEGRRGVLIRSLIHPLPFLGVVAVVVTRGWARDRLKLIALVVYVTYLTPYILVAYYRRYEMPLLGLYAMFQIWGLEAIRESLIHRVRASSPRSATAFSPVEPAAADS